MADYGQPGAVTRRVRFFDGQYLIDQDFVDEQKYHLDRERRLGKVLHITGIVEGLVVSASGANTLMVSAGTAIDGDGRLVVLAADRKVDLPAALFNDKTGVQVRLLYREVATELATTGSRSERRWLEDPQVIAVLADGSGTEKPWNDAIPPVLLAQFRLDNKGAATVDTTVAQYAGVRMPGALAVGAGAPPNPSGWRLNVNGRSRLGGAIDYGGDAVLSVAPGTVSFDAPNVPGGRFIVDGTTGNVGIGNASPGGMKLSVAGRTRLGASVDYGSEVALSVAPGSVQFDAANQPGGRLKIDGSTGYVGIGLGNDTPRSPLDTGKGVMSGAPNDYTKAQFTMTGGGTVTWGGLVANALGPNRWGGRFKWTQRFIAISMERGKTFSVGHMNVTFPTAAIPAASTWDGVARAVDATTGLLLGDWEALYAVHTVGGNQDAAADLQIRRWTNEFNAPSNWILVAVVNGDDGTLKLGTGVILAAKSSSTKGSPIPTGTILMWSGAATAIPDGWALCNGEGGRPDLRSRFIVGAGPGGTPEYTAGTSGDPDQHAHRIGIPATTFSTTTGGSHSHLAPALWYDRNFLQGGDYHGIDRGAPSVRDARTPNDGDHAHQVTVNIAGFDSAASPGTNNNRPKWYALCFIMKL